MARRLLALFLIVSLVVLGACKTATDEPNGDASFTLTVQTGGTGAGNVTSNPAGINLATGATSAAFDEDVTVTLTADADLGSSFAGWSGGGCSGTGTCTITMTANTTVTATFDDDPLGQADIEAVVDAIGTSVVAVGTDLIEDPVLYGMLWLSFSPGCIEKVSEDLRRGIFEFDPIGFVWDVVDDQVDYLECRWSFEDYDGDDRDAVLVIDWGPTTYVGWQWGPDQEVPTDGMSATLAIDNAPAGQVDASFEWYSAPNCPAGVLEPASVEINGSLGLVATLSLNDFVLTLSDTRLATSGELVAASGTDVVGIEWDVAIDGSLVRVDCFIDEFDVSSGDVSLTAFAVEAGARSSLGFNLAFDNIVLDNDWLESIDVSGSVEVNDVPALTFTGTLDDLDEPVPGANVVLTFADGTSMTLKEFIEGAQVMATTVSRLRSLVR